MNIKDAEKISPKTLALLKKFNKEVSSKGKKIDPYSERCWLSLTIGWALANGMTPNDADEFARFVRYHTDLA
jgi:hypothetical protein